MNIEHFARVMASPGSSDVIGTAYPLSGSRFLTAGHVVREKDAEFDLVWGEENDPSRAHVRCIWVRDEDVEQGGVDAAVLQYISGSKPDGMQSFLSAVPLRTNQDWQARGFAEAGHAAGGWSRPVAMNGTAYAFTKDAVQVEVSVEAPPKDPDTWSGVSGAPVFVGGLIVGCITNGARHFPGNRLLVVPAVRLLLDESFVQAADLPQEQPGFQRLLQKVKALLEADREARTRLFDEQPDWDRSYQEGGIEAFVQELLNSPIGVLVRSFNRAHAWCVQAGSQNSAGACALMNVLALLLPWSAAGEMAVATGSWDATILRLPARRAMTAELLMAGWDGREFRFGEKVRKYPHPMADAGNRAGFGFDLAGDHQFRDLSVRLTRWMLEGDYPLDRDLSAVQLENLNNELRGFSERVIGRIRYYLVLTEKQSDRGFAFLRRVEQDLPALRVIILREQSNPDENQVCRDLRDLVFRARTGEEYYPE